QQTMVLKIRELFDQAVRKRCNTDLPIAVFLSGGIDSTSVLATARKFHPKVAAIVVGKDWDSEDSDYHNAMRYCKENNIPVIARQPPTEEELFALVPTILKVTESFEPNMIKQSGFSLFLSSIAKEYGFKIVLCGEGADEVFCGYPEFSLIPQEKVKDLSLQFFRNLYRTQLQRVDRTSMAYTVEVRVPFMDVAFVEYGINIPASWKIRDSQTKWILRRAMEDRLPDYIVNRKKVVLSEGMGHKGNSLKDGMFTSFIKKTLSEKEFKKIQKKNPLYSLSNKEDAYYFSLYVKEGYKAKEFTGRTVVNKTPSVANSKDIFKQMNRGLFRRDRPRKLKELLKIIDDAILKNIPVPIVGFWGIGSKSLPDTFDFETLDYLDKLNEEIKKYYALGLGFTFIISDMHAAVNQIPQATKQQYIHAMKQILLQRGHKVMMLSPLWEKYSISEQAIHQTLMNMKPGWWESISNREFIEYNANRCSFRQDKLLAAKLYYIMRMVEKPMLEQEFKGFIFHTFSDSKIEDILPVMPTYYMYARKGWSNAPWFSEN
ncbi:MAG: asparagine synthase C-terminal domain-containing protein, partial [Candidatus Woesearchaeota archaeon]